MNAAKVIQFPRQTDPQPPREAEMSIEQKEEGYTSMPNFIVDEGYLAVLDGEAVKCLVFLNRHIKGFHLDKKGMSETLVKKVTGIRDGRTVQKHMNQLAEYQLVKIEKSKGKSNVYSLTFDERLPTQHVGTFIPPTNQVPTLNVGGVPTQRVGGSTYTACRSVKEIYLKENIKYKKSDFAVDNSESEMFSNSVRYQQNDNTRYSLRELANVYMIKSDFSEQAKNQNSQLTDEKILDELKNFAQWSTGREPTTAQGWMNYWIYRIQNLSTKPKAARQNRRTRATKNLTDSQIDMFSKKLCAMGDFASTYASTGESQKSFESRIATKLRDPENLKHWASYLRDVGFVGNVEGMA